MTREDIETLEYNLYGAIESTCIWENTPKLNNIKIGVSPDLDVYCSKPNGEWYDEYVPEDDWKIYDVEQIDFNEGWSELLIGIVKDF